MELRLFALLAIHDFLWQYIAVPDVAVALFFAGVLAIYAEFCAPGSVLPGVLGSLLILLSITALAPLSPDWRGPCLIAIALAFLLLEARYTSRGWLTYLGALALFAGLLLLFPDPPHRIHPTTAFAIAAPFAAISSFLFSLTVRARRNKTETESLS